MEKISSFPLTEIFHDYSVGIRWKKFPVLETPTMHTETPKRDLAIEIISVCKEAEQMVEQYQKKNDDLSFGIESSKFENVLDAAAALRCAVQDETMITEAA